LNWSYAKIVLKQKGVRFIKVEKEKKNEKLDLVHLDVWGLDHVSSLGARHERGKYGFIFLKKNQKYLELLKSGNIWLRMRQEKG
jgi:hypothetical protein